MLDAGSGRFTSEVFTSSVMVLPHLFSGELIREEGADVMRVKCIGMEIPERTRLLGTLGEADILLVDVPEVVEEFRSVDLVLPRGVFLEVESDRKEPGPICSFS